MNYTDFSEDERKFYLSESGFDSREKEFFRLRVYEEKTLFETAEIMGYSPRTIDRIMLWSSFFVTLVAKK